MGSIKVFVKDFLREPTHEMVKKAVSATETETITLTPAEYGLNGFIIAGKFPCSLKESIISSDKSNPGMTDQRMFSGNAGKITVGIFVSQVTGETKSNAIYNYKNNSERLPEQYIQANKTKLENASFDSRYERKIIPRLNSEKKPRNGFLVEMNYNNNSNVRITQKTVLLFDGDCIWNISVFYPTNEAKDVQIAEQILNSLRYK